MELLNRQQFFAQPSGVIFAKYEPHCFSEWQIKGSTLQYNDFNYQDFVNINTDPYEEHWEACEDFVEKKTANVDFQDWQRDGLYEDEILFAVLEKHEVRGLIERLEQTILEGYADIISWFIIYVWDFTSGYRNWFLIVTYWHSASLHFGYSLLMFLHLIVPLTLSLIIPAIFGYIALKLYFGDT